MYSVERVDGCRVVRLYGVGAKVLVQPSLGEPRPQFYSINQVLLRIHELHGLKH